MNPAIKLEWYLNEYCCARCEVSWADEWSAMCNDRCPVCDLEMTPVRSRDLRLTLTNNDYDFAARRLPMPLWPPSVAAVMQARLERS